MIDYNVVYNKFVSIAQNQAGTNLSQGGLAGDEPNVIRAFPNSVKPNYPYITVDIQDVTEEQNWELNRYINEDDHTVHENIKTLMVIYTCYGGESKSENITRAIHIIDQLHGSFMFDSIRDDIRTTLNGSVVRTTSIERIPVRLADKFIEAAAFSILFNIVDIREDVNSFTIETVDLEGDVKSLQGDEESNPITININITNQP